MFYSNLFEKKSVDMTIQPIIFKCLESSNKNTFMFDTRDNGIFYIHFLEDHDCYLIFNDDDAIVSVAFNSNYEASMKLAEIIGDDILDAFGECDGELTMTFKSYKKTR